MGVSGMPKRLEGNLRDVRCNRRAKPHHIAHLILRRLAGGSVVTGIHSCVEVRGESSRDKGVDEEFDGVSRCFGTVKLLMVEFDCDCLQ